MLGFHIDMNMFHFKRGYIEARLREFARLGYDTVIWEVENAIQWETCPEAAAPNAFSKKEFKELIALCRELKLEPVPLFQTLGHCEYVLKSERWKHLAEVPGRIDQYCPRHPDLHALLQPWIREYFDLFGPVKYFHLGADEAWTLGQCERCRSYAGSTSLSQLFVDHVNAVCQPVLERGATPIIWADMLLAHPEAIDLLSRRVMLFDWMYDIYHGSGKVHIWSKPAGLYSRDKFPPEFTARFKEYLFPEGDEPGREPAAFYSADYLASQGFDVVTCPASSSGGDSVFAPRTWLHLINTFDSVHKGARPPLKGSVLTSWTVRMHSWELQQACLELPGFAAQHPEAPLARFQDEFCVRHFGQRMPGFWKACGLLSKRCSFALSGNGHLGFYKEALPVPATVVEEYAAEIAAKGNADSVIAKDTALLQGYRAALELFTALLAQTSAGHALLRLWILAARNQINRAEAALFILQCAKQGKCPAEALPQGREVLKELRSLKEQAREMYGVFLQPVRRDEVVTWIYAPVEHALARWVAA